MVFSSITFLFYFLPFFLVIYFVCPWKNVWLLTASLIFYAWGEAEYVVLLLCSIAINYGFGLCIDEARTRSRLPLALGIASNIALLAYFKYFNFILDNFNEVARWQGFELIVVSTVHLPLGISFFTFQAITYLVDVQRGDAPVEKNPLSLAVYISMFPQLIAGPIVRYKTIADQIKCRELSTENLRRGIEIFIIGLAQKVLIANTVAGPADAIFALSGEELSTSAAWLGIVCYTLQIYYDFAGYSNMAIGLGLLLGFDFPKNFNYPYFAQSITEFWRRWHISLSTWFRDYLYIPLGGNRVSPLRTYINLALVFILVGFWHGAYWTFIVWGLYHGAFLVLERIGLGALLSRMWRPLRHAYLLLAVMIGWVIFRSESLHQAFVYLKALGGWSSVESGRVLLGALGSNALIIAICAGVLFSVPILATRGDWVRDLRLKPAPSIRLLLLRHSLPAAYFACLGGLLTLAAMNLASGTYNPFIYFRF